MDDALSCYRPAATHEIHRTVASGIKVEIILLEKLMACLYGLSGATSNDQSFWAEQGHRGLGGSGIRVSSRSLTCRRVFCLLRRPRALPQRIETDKHSQSKISCRGLGSTSGGKKCLDSSAVVPAVVEIAAWILRRGWWDRLEAAEHHVPMWRTFRIVVAVGGSAHRAETDAVSSGEVRELQCPRCEAPSVGGCRKSMQEKHTEKGIPRR